MHFRLFWTASIADLIQTKIVYRAVEALVITPNTVSVAKAIGLCIFLFATRQPACPGHLIGAERLMCNPMASSLGQHNFGLRSAVPPASPELTGL